MTLCNMNPYKTSALASLPYVAQLMEAYGRSAKTLNSTQTSVARKKRGVVYMVHTDHEGPEPPHTNVSVPLPALPPDDDQEEPHPRRKRANPTGCVCNYNSPIIATNTSIAPYTYIQYRTASWQCAFSCCAASPHGSNGMLARLDRSALYPFLKSKGILYNDYVYFGCKGAGPSLFQWYSDSTTISGPTFSICAVMAPATCNDNNGGAAYGTCLIIVSGSGYFVCPCDSAPYPYICQGKCTIDGV